MDKILTLDNVCLTYHTLQGEIEALKNLSFDVKKQEFIAIVGPSGCGKTTILSLIAGILKPTSGTIVHHSTDTQKYIGYMFQRDHLFDWRTIWQNITIGLELNNKKEIEKHRERIENLLKKYGLFDFKDKYPKQLSGGMKQRAALIRTLAMEPELLLLDEPFSALDFQTRLNVCDDVSDIISKEHKSAILVTHDISEAISMADRVIVLSNRPAYVKYILDIDLKKYGSPLKRRDSKEFHLLFDKIWEELQTNEKERKNKPKLLGWT